MSKISVVYWSQTGNTQAMAEAIGNGIKAAGKEAEVVDVSSVSLDDLKKETVFSFGMPGYGCGSLGRDRDGSVRF